MEKEYISNSIEETEVLANHLGKHLKAGTVITLEGNLGTGKTAFTKALAKSLQIKEAVTSPTFTIIKEYKGRLPLYHIDAYRLENSEEDLGLDEYIAGDGVTVIEWAQFIQEFLPDQLLNIEIDYLDQESRKFTLIAKGEYYKGVLSQVFKNDF